MIKRKARLKELIEEVLADTYTEEEQAVGFFTMIEEHLALPFTVKILGVDANVEKIDMTPDSQIVAICRRGKKRGKRSWFWTWLCPRRLQWERNG